MRKSSLLTIMFRTNILFPNTIKLINPLSDRFSEKRFEFNCLRARFAKIPKWLTNYSSKLKKIFDTYTNAGLISVRPITKNLVKLVKTGDGYGGQVLCIFCSCNESDNELLQRWFCVQCESSNMYS